MPATAVFKCRYCKEVKTDDNEYDLCVVASQRGKGDDHEWVDMTLTSRAPAGTGGTLDATSEAAAPAAAVPEYSCRVCGKTNMKHSAAGACTDPTCASHIKKRTASKPPEEAASEKKAKIEDPATTETALLVPVATKLRTARTFNKLVAPVVAGLAEMVEAQRKVVNAETAKLEKLEELSAKTEACKAEVRKIVSTDEEEASETAEEAAAAAASFSPGPA